MKKFNINKDFDNVENKSLGEKASLIENKKDFDLRYIPVEKIIPNPENFYEITGVKELADSIKEFGLMQNLEVSEVEKEGDKYYRIITGHRRYEAIKLLISQGEKYDTIPCKVERDLTQIEESIRLIKSNSDTRELSQEEKRKQVEKLNKLYGEKASITGEKINKKEIKETVAADVGMSAKQVERYNTINENLIPDLKDYFDNEKISFVEAVKFARLDEQMQLAILDLLQQKDKISNEEIEIIKKENSKLLEDNKAKEKELEEKRNLIINLKNEKQSLEEEKEQNQIEQEVAEEEKKKLEKKIREEIAQLTEEELNKLKNQLEEASKKAKELADKEKTLTQELQDKNNEIEEIRKSNDENKESSGGEQLLTQEQLQKAVAQEKYRTMRAAVVKEIVELGNLAKKFDISEAEDTLSEIEKAISVYRKKVSSLSN